MRGSPVALGLSAGRAPPADGAENVSRTTDIAAGSEMAALRFLRSDAEDPPVTVVRDIRVKRGED